MENISKGDSSQEKEPEKKTSVSVDVQTRNIPVRKQENRNSSGNLGIINIPRDLTIHLKPDCFVHDIQLTSTKIRILTERDTKEYFFPIKKEGTKSSGNESKKETKGLKELKSSKELTSMKVKPVILKHETEIENAFAAGHANLDEKKGNCLRHTKITDKCTDGVCECLPVQAESTEEELDSESQNKKHECCLEKTCVCCQQQNTSRKVSIHDKLDYNVLALDTIQYFEEHPMKLKLLELKVETVIPAAFKALNIEEKSAKRLSEALRRHMPHACNKLKLKKLTKKEIFEVLYEVEKSLPSVKEKKEDETSMTSLNEIANSIHTKITDTRGENTKSVLILDLKTKLRTKKLSSNEVKEVVQIIKDKVQRNKYLLDDKKPISEAHQSIINQINKTLESLDDYKSCCNICGHKVKVKSTQRPFTAEEIFSCKKPQCGKPRTADMVTIRATKTKKKPSSIDQLEQIQKPIEIIQEETTQRRPNIYDATYSAIKS